MRISIHSPHTGRDNPSPKTPRRCRTFQSTLPTRGETPIWPVLYRLFIISIHSPHTGRDHGHLRQPDHLSSISIHSPHTGRDEVPEGGYIDQDGFQSTLPTRGETQKPERRDCQASEDFNPLSPHGERQTLIHKGFSAKKFQSTLPTRGETFTLQLPDHSQKISIHSPHTGRDEKNQKKVLTAAISIHSPHTGRDRPLSLGKWSGCIFQSTLPTRGETPSCVATAWPIQISIHSPHTGRDGCTHFLAAVQQDFNPLSPHGERRRYGLIGHLTLCNFNPLSPHGERLIMRKIEKYGENFNPLSPHGERHFCRMINRAQKISIHSPHTGRDYPPDA